MLKSLLVAPSSLPLRYEGQDYKIVEAGIDEYVPYAKVSPANPSLEEELKRRIARDNGLRAYHHGDHQTLID